MVQTKTLIAMGLTAISASSIALAQISTEYPGTFCVVRGTTQNIFYGGNGDARNPATNVSRFVCPAIQQGGDVVDLSLVSVLDSHSSDDVSCSVNVRGLGSLSGVVGPAVSSAGMGIQTLFFDPLPAFVNGVKFITCDVPEQQEGRTSRVLSYRVTEQ